MSHQIIQHRNDGREVIEKVFNGSEGDIHGKRTQFKACDIATSIGTERAGNPDYSTCHSRELVIFVGHPSFLRNSSVYGDRIHAGHLKLLS